MSNVARCVIEFAGIPGSGKSALYIALARARNLHTPEFLTSGEFLAAPRFPVLTAVLERAAARVAVHRSNRLARRLYRAPSAQRTNQALRGLGDEYRAFLRVCLGTAGEDGEWPEYRLMGFRWLSDVIELYALFEAAQRVVRPMLMDEGLAQKAPALIPLNAQSSRRRSAYYESMPLVRTVVFLKTPAAIAQQRLVARSSGVTLRHGYLTEREMIDDLAAMDKAFTDGLRMLAQRGIEVVELDGTQPLANNVSTLLDYFGTLDVQGGSSNATA